MRRAPTEPRRVRWLPCCLGSAPALLVLFLPPSASLLTMALARDFSPLARGCVGVNGRSIPVQYCPLPKRASSSRLALTDDGQSHLPGAPLPRCRHQAKRLDKIDLLVLFLDAIYCR